MEKHFQSYISLQLTYVSFCIITKLGTIVSSIYISSIFQSSHEPPNSKTGKGRSAVSITYLPSRHDNCPLIPLTLTFVFYIFYSWGRACKQKPQNGFGPFWNVVAHMILGSHYIVAGNKTAMSSGRFPLPAFLGPFYLVFFCSFLFFHSLESIIGGGRQV